MTRDDADLGHLIRRMLGRAIGSGGNYAETWVPFIIEGKEVAVLIRVYNPNRKEPT